MEKKSACIEVFQDLFLEFSDERRQQVRRALQEHAATPWHHAKEWEENLGKDYMAFERDSKDDLPSSGLALWSQPYGYCVANIVPLKIGELGVPNYNDVLNDFLERVVNPASKNVEFYVKISARRQSITDWTSQEAANALHRFAVTANKSTGSSHPSDQDRWFEFLFAVRKAPKRLRTYRLGRWLTEVEEWPPEVVTRLIIEYEFAMDLLDKYDHDS